MKREDLQETIADVKALQNMFAKVAGYTSMHGDEAIALLQAELAKPKTIYKPQKCKREDLTQEILKQELNYDSETGIFTAVKTTCSTRRKGEQVGTNRRGYLVAGLFGVSYLLHRLAWFYVYGEWPNMLDHINGNPRDNRISNLRAVSSEGNQMNRRVAQKNNIAGLLGVSKHRDRWQAKININDKTIYVGTFDTPELAHEAYLKSKREMHTTCTI